MSRALQSYHVSFLDDLSCYGSLNFWHSCKSNKKLLFRPICTHYKSSQVGSMRSLKRSEWILKYKNYNYLVIGLSFVYNVRNIVYLGYRNTFSAAFLCSAQTSTLLRFTLCRVAPFTHFQTFLRAFVNHSWPLIFTPLHAALRCMAHIISKATEEAKPSVSFIHTTSAHKSYCWSLLWKYQWKHLTLWVCMCAYNYCFKSHFCIVPVGPGVRVAIFDILIPLMVRLTPAWAISPSTDGTAPTHT